MSSARRVMLITGGTGSIGGEVARQAAASGWTVVLHGRAADRVEAAVVILREEVSAKDLQGCEIMGVVADIKQEGAVLRLVEEAGQHFGRIDAMVDCLAAGPESGRIAGVFADTTPEAYAVFAEYSLVYQQRLAHAVLPWLQKSKGTLVAFTSDAGLFAAPRQVLIGSARAATIGLVRNLALEVARDGVRVHCISPGFVDETRVAQRLEATAASRLDKARQRAGLGLPTPADIAPAVLFLCGDGARRMTGQVLSINGGVNA